MLDSKKHETPDSLIQGISLLMGTLFIDIDDNYCFGTELPISMSKYVYQYRHFN